MEIKLANNIIPFLQDLAKNNNKEWFDENKNRYKQAHAEFIQFVDNLIQLLSRTDESLKGVEAKQCVYRIYRDVRFSKDKTPYKIHFGAHIAVGGRKSKGAGFYIHIEPMGQSIVGGGIYMPEPAVLKALRTEFHSVPEELLDIIENKEFKKKCGKLWDKDKLKLAPKGFPKDFEHIELLKYKSYISIKELSLDEITAGDFVGHLVDTHKAMYPLNRLINDIISETTS